MAEKKLFNPLRKKLLMYALIGLAACVLLLVLSQVVVSTAPENAAMTAPVAPGSPAQPSPREAAAKNLSGMLLLFGTSGAIFSAVCFGWLIYDIRNDRPSWQKQTKIPKKR